MPHVGETNEPLLSRAMYGYNGSLWKPVLLDANGLVKVTLSTISEYVHARGYGYIGGAWQRSPLNLGYTRTLDFNWNGTAAGSSYNKSTGGVPAGEIWTFEAISFVNYNWSITRVNYYIIKASGGYVNLYNNTSPTFAIPDIFVGKIVMSVGDNLTMVTTGNAVGNTIECAVTGFVTEIDL